MLEWCVEVEQNYIGSIIIKKREKQYPFPSGEGDCCFVFFFFNILSFLKPQMAVASGTGFVLVPIIDGQNQKCQYSTGTRKKRKPFQKSVNIWLKRVEISGW